MIYDWDWSVLWQYRGALLAGTTWTIVLWLTCVAIGTVLGLLWGLLLSSQSAALAPLRMLGVALNDTVRALPPLILLLLINYSGMALLSIRSTFWICAFSLSLNLAAFIADVLRGAVAGVPRAHRQAALAVGMSDNQVMWRIIIPDVVRSTIPSVALLYIDNLKTTSLASVLGLPELTHVGGEVIAMQFRPLEIFVAIGLIYIAIVIPLSHLQRYLETSTLLVRRS